jgi:hypothetical protein
VQIGGAEIKVNQEGPVALLRQDHPEGAGQEALSGAAFPPSDWPYMRHPITHDEVTNSIPEKKPPPRLLIIIME